MSPNTFIKWFFTWLAAFKIDFRKEVDPWCGHKPEMLACDGTHIGVSLRQMNLRNPVTSPDPTLPVLDAHHKRYNKVHLTDTHMRKHLSYLSRKYLRKLRPEECLDANIEAERKGNSSRILVCTVTSQLRISFLPLFRDQRIRKCII